MLAPHYLLPTAYFPNLEYMALLLAAWQGGGQVQLEAQEYYVKQTYRNRAYVLGPHQVELLTVPVLGGTKKIFIQEVELDNSQPWQRLHWRTLTACYGKSPFWEHYAPLLKPLFNTPYTHLWQLNKAALTMCLQLLTSRGEAARATPGQTSAYKKHVEPPCFDLRLRFRPAIPYQERALYTPVPYVQVFGASFVENLSVLDLLFCQGPHAQKVLQQSFGQA